MTSTQMEQLRLIKMENEQKRLREAHHQKHYQPYKNYDGQGQSVKQLKPLKKNIFFPNASHVHIHRGAEQRQHLSQEPPRPTLDNSRGLHQRELYSKHNNQFPETSVHPRQHTERRPYTNLENQLAKEKPLTRTMQQKKVKKELLFLGGQGNHGASQNLPEIGGSQSRTNAGPSIDGYTTTGRKPKGRVVGMEHLKAMNHIYAEKLRDAEQFRTAQAPAQHSQPKGTKKTGRWKQKVSPRHQQLIARRPVGLYASSPKGGKTFDSLPAVGSNQMIKHARDRDQELAAWARGGGQQAATTGTWAEDDEPRHPYGAQRIPLRGDRGDAERQPPRDEAWQARGPGGRETPGNSEPYLNRADDFGGDAADLRALQQESDRHSAQEGFRDGKHRGSKNRLDMLHEDSMPDFLSDDYTGADELNDLALNWPGPVKDGRYKSTNKLDAHLQVVTDPPAVQAVSQEGAPSPRMETVTNQEARRAAKGVDFALADAAEERRVAHLNKKARQAFLPEVQERSHEHLKLKKYLAGDPAAHTKNKYQVREEPAPHQVQRKRNLKSVLPAIRSSRNQTAGEEPNFEVADHQARRKKPTHTTSKKHSNPDNLLKSSLHTNTRHLQPERLPHVSSKLLKASDSRQRLASGHLPDSGLRSGQATHQPRPLEHTRNHGSSKALGVKKPSGYSLKVTEFNPPHLHTQDRFEAHNRETCEGCQLADRRKREDDARAMKKNSSSPKKARLALDSAHRSPQRLRNLSSLSPDRKGYLKRFRSLDSGSGSPTGSRHHGVGGGARRIQSGRDHKHEFKHKQHQRAAGRRSTSQSPQGRPNLHLNNHHTQHSPEERPRIIGGGGRLSPSRYQLTHQLRDKEHQTLSPKGRNHNLQLPSAKQRRPAKRVNNFTPRHGEQNSPGSAGRAGKEDHGTSSSPAVRLPGQDRHQDDENYNAPQAAGAPRHSKSPPRAGPPRVPGTYESATGREKIWRDAVPGHRRVVSKDRFGRLAHDNKEVAGSPDSGRLRQPSGKRTKAAAAKQQQKKPVAVQPKEKARLPKAIDHSTASLRKPKPGPVDRQRSNTMTSVPDADSSSKEQDIRLPASRQLGGDYYDEDDDDDAEPIRLQTSNLQRGRNLFEHSNQQTLDGEAKGAADVEQSQDIEEDIMEAKKRISPKVSDKLSAHQDIDEDLPSDIVNLNLADQIAEAAAKRRNDVSPFSLPPEYTAPLERSAGDSNSQKPAAVAAEAVPGLATPEGQASQMGSVGKDSAPSPSKASQLNRVRFKDEVEDQSEDIAPPDVEEQSQNKSSKSSLVADVQGDVAILDRTMNTMSSKASGSRGPAEAANPAPQSDVVTPKQASKTASSNVIGSKQSEPLKTLEKQSSRTSDVMSQLKRANSIRAPPNLAAQIQQQQQSSKSRERSASVTPDLTSPSKLVETLGHGSTTEAEVSIISEQSTAKELAVNSHQRSGTNSSEVKKRSEQVEEPPSHSTKNDGGPATAEKPALTRQPVDPDDATAVEPENSSTEKPVFDSIIHEQEQEDDPIHIQNQSEHPPAAVDKSAKTEKDKNSMNNSKKPNSSIKGLQEPSENISTPKVEEPSKRQSSQAQEQQEQKYEQSNKSFADKAISEAKRQQSKSSKKQSRQEELKLTPSAKESSEPGDAESGQQRSRNDSLPQLAKSKHSLASVNEQLNRTGADSRFRMDEAPESRNHQLAQTQSLTRSPQKIEADSGAAASGSRRQETEKADKGILRNKDEHQRTASSKDAPLGRAGVPDDALKRRKQRQEAHRKKHEQSEKAQKEEKIGPNDWGYASAFKQVDSGPSEMHKTQDNLTQSAAAPKKIKTEAESNHESALKDKIVKRPSDRRLSEAQSKSQKSRRSIRERQEPSRRGSTIDERSPRRSSKGKDSVHEQHSPSRKSGADDARSLSRKRSSASAYPKWVDGKKHRSGVRAVESEVSHHQAERSPPRRQQTTAKEPDVKKPEKQNDRHWSPVEERRKQPTQRGPQSEHSRSPSPQVKARPAVHQATSTGGQKQEEQQPELCSSHQYSMSAMAMEASEAGEAPPRTPTTPPRKQKQKKLKPQKVLVDTAQSPGALQESDSSIESVDLKQVQKDVKEAATEPDAATQVQHAEAQTMTSVNKPRGREIQTQTEPLSPPAQTPKQVKEEEPAATTPQSSEKHQTEKASTVQDAQQEEEEDEASERPDEEEEVRPPSTKSSPAEQKPEEPEATSGPVDPLDATIVAPARDWYRSGIYDLALDVVNLPAAGQLAAARALEQHFCNPNGLDVFTEAEAGYNASLLRQKGAAAGADLQAATDAAHDLELLQALYRKATRTVELLSEHVLLTKACGCAVDGHESHDEDHEEEEDHGSPEAKPEGGALSAAQKGSAPEALIKVTDEQQEPGGQEPASMALRHDDYREHNVGVETVIKLLLRCKKLYQAMAEVKKVLQLIIKQEELFDTESGPVYTCLRKYRPAVSDPPLAQADEAALERGFRVLVQASRRIAHFLDDHLIYKQFIYKGQEHRIALLQHAWKLHRFFKRKKGDDSHARLVDDIQKNLAASLEGLEDTSAQSSYAAIAEGGQERSSLVTSSVTAKRQDLAGNKRGQEDEVEHGSRERAIGGKEKTLDQKPRGKAAETPQPKGKANSKAAGDNSRSTPSGVGAKEAGPVSQKKPKAQDQKSKPTGESLAKPKAQPTPAAPVALSLPKVSEAGSAEQSQNHKPEVAREQAASKPSTQGVSKRSVTDDKSAIKDHSSGKDNNRSAQAKTPSDMQKTKPEKKQPKEQTSTIPKTKKEEAGKAQAKVDDAKKKQNAKTQLDDLRKSQIMDQIKKQPSVVSRSQQSLAKSSKPSEKSRNVRQGMQRGKRDEDQSIQSVSGSVHSKPGRATAPGLGKAPPKEEGKKPTQLTSQGVQTSPAAVQEQEAQAASPDWPQRKMEAGSQYQEQGAGSKAKKETRDAASSPLIMQPALAEAAQGPSKQHDNTVVQEKSFMEEVKDYYKNESEENAFQDYIESNHSEQLKRGTANVVKAQQSEGKAISIDKEHHRVENTTPSVGDAMQPPGSPPIAHTPPLGAARQHRPAEFDSFHISGNAQHPRATATEASQEMANLTRSNELLASRVSQLASKLESSVDLDAMIKENYQLLRQGARVESKLKEDNDVNGPGNGRLPQSDARVVKKEPSKVKGAGRYGEEAKAGGAPVGLAPRAEQHILLEERSRTPAIPQHGAGQDQQFWSHAEQSRDQHEIAYVRHVDSQKSQATVEATAQARIARDGSISSVTELASFGKVIEAGKRAHHDNEYGQTAGPTKVTGQQPGSWALAPQNTQNKSLPSKHFPEDFFKGRSSTELPPPGRLPQGDVQDSGHLTFANPRASAPNAQVPIPSNPGLK